MKSPILLLTFAGLCAAQTTVNGGRDYKGTLKASGGVSAVDFSTAGATAPVKSGTASARPAACTQGQLYFATDAIAGQNLYFCTVTGSPGTWSQMSATAASTGSGPAGGNCTPPSLYIDTTNQDLWYCASTNTWKKPTTDTSGFATLSGANTWTGYNNLSTAQWRPPESTVAALPAAAGNNGKVFMVTDGASVGSCTSGGGASRVFCRSTGTVYECVGNCSTGGGGGGGGTPGGNNGDLQINSNGSFAGQAAVLAGGGSNRFQRGLECATGTISLSGGTWTYPAGTVAATAATSQEIPIVTGLNGNMRYAHVLLAESTQFAGTAITATKVSLGRPGAGTNDEMLAQTNFMQSSGNAWFTFDRPQPPVIGGSNTYSIVFAVRTTGGNVSALTAGAVYYEVCGFQVQ